MTVVFVIQQARTDGSVLSPESPSPSTKPRRSLTSKLKDTTESLKSRSKSRERIPADKSSSLKKDSKNKGVFSSTLSLFKKRERKKSYDEAIAASCDLDAPRKVDHPSVDTIGNVEFTFNAEKEKSRQDDSIFISLHPDDRNYEEALPSESVSIPLETPTKLLDEYESEGPHARSMITEVSIEHHPAPPSSVIAKIRTEAQIETTQIISRSSSRDSQLPQSASKDSQMSKSSSRESKISTHANKVEKLPSAKSSTKSDIKSEVKPDVKSRASSGTSSISSKKPEVTKPKRKKTSGSSGDEDHKSKDSQQQPKLPEKTDDATTQKKKISLKESLQAVQEAKKPDLLDDKIGKQDGLVKTSSVISDLDHNSSESEKDSEIEFIRSKVEKLAEELPDERKGLFYEESFEEDLPYVPTTLPLEKSVAVPILPVKQRLQEVR